MDDLSPCPVCETPSKFIPVFVSNGKQDYGRLIIRCTTCNWQKTLRATSMRLERIIVKEKALVRLYSDQVQMYFQPTDQTARRLQTATALRQYLEDEVRKNA